ncbi:MAG: hypothetical protein HQL51_08995 [Magnetococcales bacterium]|nr:hypothetical protein [Magnetococcales bacterium]
MSELLEQLRVWAREAAETIGCELVELSLGRTGASRFIHVVVDRPAPPPGDGEEAETAPQRLPARRFKPGKGPKGPQWRAGKPLRGVTAGDCQAISRQLNGLILMHEALPESYRLEVASPGEERPLRLPEDAMRFMGRRVMAQLAEPLPGPAPEHRRRFTGWLREADSERLTLELSDGSVVLLPLTAIVKARLHKID